MSHETAIDVLEDGFRPRKDFPCVGQIRATILEKATVELHKHNPEAMVTDIDIDIDEKDPHRLNVTVAYTAKGLANCLRMKAHL